VGPDARGGLGALIDEASVAEFVRGPAVARVGAAAKRGGMIVRRAGNASGIRNIVRVSGMLGLRTIAEIEDILNRVGDSEMEDWFRRLRQQFPNGDVIASPSHFTAEALIGFSPVPVDFMALRRLRIWSVKYVEAVARLR